MLRIKLTFALAAALLVTSTARPAATELDFFAKDQASQDIAVLKSDATQKEKADACMRLAVFGGADAVAPLAALLPDEKLSHMARYALETIPDPSVDPALREALGKVQGRLLAGVIGSLGVRKDAQAVDQRPNMPGTIEQWPNWSLALPQDIETMVAAELPGRIARALGRGRQPPPRRGAL